MKKRVGFKKSLYVVMQNVIRKEISNLLKQKNSVFHGGKTLKEIEQFNWDDRFKEVCINCPTLSNILVGALTSKKSSNVLGLAYRPEISVKPTVGTVISIMLYQLKPRKMTDLPEMNALQMWLAGCKREVINSSNMGTERVDVHTQINVTKFNM